MVRMGSQENKENKDHLDLKELKDLQDLGVLESPTLGGERAPALTPTILNWSTLEELGGVTTILKEEELIDCVCLLTLTTLPILDQLLQLIILFYMEQSITLIMAHNTAFMTTMSPVLSAMLPPEL